MFEMSVHYDWQETRKLALEEGIELGIEKGIEKGKIEVARNLLSLGLDIDKIVKATGLSEEDIKKLLS